MVKIWSSVAIDYRYGTRPYDIKEDKYYTEEEARQLSKEIQTRLVNKARKIGCYVEGLNNE